MCNYRHREAFYVHHQVSGRRCLDEKRCSVKDRNGGMPFRKEGRYKLHDERFAGVRRE